MTRKISIHLWAGRTSIAIEPGTFDFLWMSVSDGDEPVSLTASLSRDDALEIRDYLTEMLDADGEGVRAVTGDPVSRDGAGDGILGDP
jgi:hypothetical protein